MFNCHLIDFMCLSSRRSFNSLCFFYKMHYRPEKKDFIITKLHLSRWNEKKKKNGKKKKNIQDFNKHMCIDWCGIGYYLPSFVNWHATPYHKWLGQIYFFRQSFLYVLFEQHLTKVPDSWVITEYDFHSIVHTRWLFLFAYFELPFFCLCVSTDFRLTFLYTGWNDKIVFLKKTTLQIYLKTFIEKINSANLIM